MPQGIVENSPSNLRINNGSGRVVCDVVCDGPPRPVTVTLSCVGCRFHRILCHVINRVSK